MRLCLVDAICSHRKPSFNNICVSNIIALECVMISKSTKCSYMKRVEYFINMQINSCTLVTHVFILSMYDNFVDGRSSKYDFLFHLL